MPQDNRLPLRRTVPALLLLWAAACGGGVSVNTQYDPAGTSISETYQSFDWLSSAPGAAPRAEPEGLESLIHELVEQALVSRGYTRIPAAPHFRVGWHYTTQPTLVTSLNLHYPYTWGRWFPGGGVNFGGRYRTEIPAGTLVLDAMDVSTSELLWRTMAPVELEDTPAARRAAFAEAITAMVAKFPRP